MTRVSKIADAPPYAVETALQTLGANLRTARLRRGLTIEEMGQKVGVGRRAVMDAEKGKPATAIGIYAGLLSALDLIEQLGGGAGARRGGAGADAGQEPCAAQRSARQ